MKELAEILNIYLKFLPEEFRKIEILEHEICCLSGAVSITPTIIEQKRIGGSKEFPGWALSTFRVVSNYPHEPDDVDQTDVAESRNPHVIARKTVVTMLELLVEWEGDRLADIDFEQQMEDSHFE